MYFDSISITSFIEIMIQELLFIIISTTKAPNLQFIIMHSSRFYSFE